MKQESNDKDSKLPSLIDDDSDDNEERLKQESYRDSKLPSPIDRAAAMPRGSSADRTTTSETCAYGPSRASETRANGPPREENNIDKESEICAVGPSRPRTNICRRSCGPNCKCDPNADVLWRGDDKPVKIVKWLDGDVMRRVDAGKLAADSEGIAKWLNTWPTPSSRLPAGKPDGLSNPYGSNSSWWNIADDGSPVGRNKINTVTGRPPTPKPIHMGDDHDKTPHNGIFCFRRIKNGQVCSFGANNEGWVEVEICIDSGACETVMPASLCPGIDVVDSQQSIEGVEYEVANGGLIPNLGERRCLLTTPGSEVCKQIVFQVADVHKTLMSVSRVADMGYSCHLGATGGCLEDLKSGERIPLTRRDDLYYLNTWVKKDPFVRPA